MTDTAPKPPVTAVDRDLIESAPTHGRPRCRHCGDPLKPNYESVWQNADTAERTYLAQTITDEQADALEAAGFPVERGDPDHEYASGRFNRIVPEPFSETQNRRLVLRTFDGVYGKRNVFCHDGCASAWAFWYAKNYEPVNCGHEYREG